MAQRRKRMMSRRGKLAKQRKASGRAKIAQKTKARRVPGKVRPKKTATRARPKRAVAKKTAPRKTKPLRPPADVPAETIIVDTVEEPTPGVLVVTETEYDVVRARRRAPPRKSNGE